MALIADRWHQRRRAARRRHRRHGDVESRARALPRRAAASTLLRTRVGDRYVVEHMRADGYNVGGEQSGHIVLSDFATTGDGLIAAFRCWPWSSAGQAGERGAASSSSRCRSVLRNVRFAAARPLEHRRRSRRRSPTARRGSTAAAASDPRVRHRAPDPRHGRGRGPLADRQAGRRAGVADRERGRLTGGCAVFSGTEQLCTNRDATPSFSSRYRLLRILSIFCLLTALAEEAGVVRLVSPGRAGNAGLLPPALSPPPSAVRVNPSLKSS